MGDPVRLRFAKEYGMPIDDVERLVRLAAQAAECNEHYCNGDSFLAPNPKPQGGYRRIADKNEASKFWGTKVDETSNQILALAIPYGFTGIEYTGLRPCLKRGSQYVEIPA